MPKKFLPKKFLPKKFLPKKFLPKKFLPKNNLAKLITASPKRKHQKGNTKKENEMNNLKVHLIATDVELPTRKTEFSVGFDLVLPKVMNIEAKWHTSLSWSEKYTTDNPVILHPDRIYKIGLGLRFGEDHDKTVWCRIASRSSLSDKMTLLGGTIDGDYPDEWILKFRCDLSFEIRPGMAIAQAIFERRAEVSGLPTLAVARTGGFGSTNS